MGKELEKIGSLKKSYQRAPLTFINH